ncbi:MAG: right-handed parallel beta-helix repeat-containing protein [Planctomycetaceae bacterium]|nr:right-handed parallel beta-helix repeat-containing protein [Planctomycetaceae bacterium]
MPTTSRSLTQRIARQLRIAARFLIPRRDPSSRRVTSTTRPPQSATASRRRSRTGTGMLPAALLLASAAQSVWGAAIYVDSRRGLDSLDGSTQTRVSQRSGPVRTLRRAMRVAGPGDRIVLTDNGTPYEAGLSLYGLQQSGSPSAPIEIVGNGCTISGAQQVEPTAWQMVDDKVWRITPLRKGWYQLILNGEALPEVACPVDAAERPDLAESQWCAYRGAFYFRPPAGKDPPDLPLQIAAEQTGLSFVAVENVIVRDMIIEHFRQDGIHLHDRCRNITLENVTCRQNGRAGIVVGGTSSVLLRGVVCEANRVDSLRVEDLAVADAEESTFDVRPTVQTLE